MNMSIEKDFYPYFIQYFSFAYSVQDTSCLSGQ